MRRPEISCRISGVRGDKLGHDTTESLNTKGKRSDIEQENVSAIANKNTALNRSANSDSFIGVDTLAGLTAEDSLDSLVYSGHMCHTTNQDNLIDLQSLDSSV